MNINAIFNREEIWLPNTVKKAGIPRVLDIEDILAPEGIIIPRSYYRIAYSAYADKSKSAAESGNMLRLDIITASNLLHSYRFGVKDYIVCDCEEIPKNHYTVLGDDNYGNEMGIVATYMFAKGLIKTPKEFLTKLRKNMHVDKTFNCYKINELMKQREELYGNAVPIVREWNFKG